MILVTKRLFLRELQPADAEFAYTLNSDPEVMRYTGEAPFSDVEAARTFLENYTSYRVHGFGRWAVGLRANGALIGWCGLRRDPEHGEIDLGYRLMRAHWGAGYATEAALACRDWGFERFGFEEIAGYTRPENLGSVRVLEKVGFAYTGDWTEDGSLWWRFAQKREQSKL